MKINVTNNNKVGGVTVSTSPSVDKVSLKSGAPGPVGLTGAQGTQGTQGAGSPGSQGAQGAQGAQGVQGSGSQGIQGLQGVQGLTGAGSQGAQGTAGSGVQGAQGVQGTSIQGAQGTSVQGVQGTYGPQGTQGIQGITGSVSLWSRKTSNYTTSSKDRIIADTSGGAFTITLPATPVTGDFISIYDGADFSANPPIVDRNGSTIEGYADNVALDIGGTTYDFVYDGTTWEITAALGKQGIQGATGTGGTGLDIFMLMGV
jgi:hypothetical protein